MPEKKNLSILIAEDDLPLLEALTDIFTERGYRVIRAKDGKEALELSEVEKPDIYLLDILMPEIDGIDVMQRIRNHSWGKNKPMILLTNVEPNSKIAEQIKKDPPCYYLVKSDVEIDEVVRKVEELV